MVRWAIRPLALLGWWNASNECWIFPVDLTWESNQTNPVLLGTNIRWMISKWGRVRSNYVAGGVLGAPSEKTGLLWNMFRSEKGREPLKPSNLNLKTVSWFNGSNGMSCLSHPFFEIHVSFPPWHGFCQDMGKQLYKFTRFSSRV